MPTKRACTHNLAPQIVRLVRRPEMICWRIHHTVDGRSWTNRLHDGLLMQATTDHRERTLVLAPRLMPFRLRVPMCSYPCGRVGRP